MGAPDTKDREDKEPSTPPPPDAWSDALASPFLRPSFSQFGEDRTLWWIFAEKQHGFYVDIGCNHPLNLSNTALLHLRNNWSGLNIDLDPRSIALFDKARPNDCNIVAAVGRDFDRMEATIYECGEQNTIGVGKAELAHAVHEKRMVDVVPLSILLDRHIPTGTHIDLMNIDVEGFDLDVLASNDWTKYQPTVIAVEVDVHDMAVLVTLPVHRFLVSHGYTLLSHAVVTSIYHKN